MSCEGSSVKAGARPYCVMKTRRNFDDAAHDCARMSGRLAIVGDDAQNKALLSVIGSPWGYGSGLWLGCTDSEKEGTWLCDGKPMAFASWAPGQPDNQLALDDCLEWLADSGQWNDATCSVALGYVCRGDGSLRCNGRRLSAGGAAFCAHGDKLADWDGAKKACEADGGKLATVASADESRALFASLGLPSSIPSWQPTEGVWIADRGKGTDCTTLTLGDGKRIDTDCGTPLPYVCEAKP
jgi:hypothetical protein